MPERNKEMIGEPWERPALDFRRVSTNETTQATSDERVPRAPDDHTTATTDFLPSDADDVEKWQRLRRRHECTDSSDEREVREHEVDAYRYARTVCSQLGMSAYAQERVVLLIDTIGIQELDRTASMEAVVFTYVTFVANEQNRRVRTETRFDELREAASVDHDEIRRLRDLVRSTDVWRRLRQRG